MSKVPQADKHRTKLSLILVDVGVLNSILILSLTNHTELSKTLWVHFSFISKEEVTLLKGETTPLEQG